MNKVAKYMTTCAILLMVAFQQHVVGQVIDTSLVRTTDTTATQDTTSDDVLKSKVKYHARDSMRVDIENEIVYLYGDATVDYEDLHLKANYIKLDMNNKELYAEGTLDSAGNLVGKPEYSQGPQQFKSNTVRYNFETKRGKIGYVMTKEAEGYIHGEVVKKDPYNNFYIRNGQYTTCDLDTPHFALSSRRLKVISNNKIVTGPAFLTIEQIPTPLLIPFGFFPNKKGRASGLIFPAYGESNRLGFYFKHLGYYFGFNDYFNAALTTDLYTKGSYVVDVSSRYVKRYHYGGAFMFSYSETLEGEPELPDFKKFTDYHISWSHSQDAKAKPNSQFNAIVNAGTSTFYQNTISSPTNYLNNQLSSSISYSKTFPESPFSMGIRASHSQNTITRDISVTLPDFNFNVARQNIGGSNIVGRPKWYQKIYASYDMRAQNIANTKDTLLFRKETLDDLQNGMSHSIPVTTSFNVLKYVSLTPAVNFTDRMYLRTVRYEFDQVEKDIDTVQVRRFQNAFDYTSSVSASTRIYGMYQFTKGPVAAVRHVLNPSVAFIYRPDYGMSRYGYYQSVTDSTGRTVEYSIFNNTVYGGPPNGRFGNIAFGLDNNLEMKVKTETDTGMTLKKIKLFESLRISGGYNLAADSMNLSNFSVGARTNILDKVDFTFNGTLDPYAYDTNNIDYDRYQFDVDGRLARLTNANFGVNFSLHPSSTAKTPAVPPGQQNAVDYMLHPEEYVDFNIPFNLSVGYTRSYSRRGGAAPTNTSSVSVNGDVNLTPKWKVTFNSWYDFPSKQFTSVSINIYRDLHCWEMRLNWIPFGFQQSYNFQINVKSSMLQDLKLVKTKSFYDR